MMAGAIDFPLSWAPVRPRWPSFWDPTLVDRRRVHRRPDPRWRRAGALTLSGLAHGLVGLCVMTAGQSPPPYRPADASAVQVEVQPWLIVHPLALPQTARAKPASGVRIRSAGVVTEISAGPPGPPILAAPASDAGLWAAPFRTVLGQAKAAVRGGVGCAHVDVAKLPTFERAFCRSPPGQPYVAPPWQPGQLYHLPLGDSALKAAGPTASPAGNPAKAPSQ